MQNKSMSSDTSDRNRPSLKRKHDDTIRDVNADTDCLTVRSKKMRVLQEDDRNQSIQDLANGKVQERQEVIDEERSNELNESELVQRESGDLFEETNSSQRTDHQISMSANQAAVFQGEVSQKDARIDHQHELASAQYGSSSVHQTGHQTGHHEKTDAKLKSHRPKLASPTPSLVDAYQQQLSPTDSNYLKYYLNLMHQQSGKEAELRRLEKPSALSEQAYTERSMLNEQLKLDQLNYVQLLNYHHCLMAKSLEMNKSLADRNPFTDKSIQSLQSLDKFPSSLDKNQSSQLKAKLSNNYSLNDQQLSQLNSQLINSPGFKQLIEKNRTLRLNLAYQKLQAENPTFSLPLPLRTVRPCRRQRTTFTNEQTIKLEIEYRQNEYISRNKRFQLADLLDLSENQIKIWFQNRRAKDKRLERAILDQQIKQIWN